MHIHILGICGTFMGGVAALAQALGHRVTGCDTNVYPPMSTQLMALGIELIEGFEADQVKLEPDLYVIGNVAKRGMPLVEEILNRNLPYLSGPQWLGDYLLRDKWPLIVAGTHGKTTTSAMLAWILEANGLNPGFLIGGIPRNFDRSARLTDSAFFVLEADEYDTAFFDKRSKFVHYHPRTAILNNLEYDHADIFPDLAAIETQFHHLVRTVPGQGRLVVNADQPALGRVLSRGCWSEVCYFSATGDAASLAAHDTDAGWRVVLSAAQVDGRPGYERFAVWQGTQHWGDVEWTLNGAHNRANALAAIIAAQHVGVRPGDACAALARFAGVKRRMEKRGAVAGITVYDDFAHHPTAIATTLAGLIQQIPAHERVLAVLEPRSNTMKLGVMKAQLPASLEAAAAIFCYDNQLGWDVAAALAPLGEKAVVEGDMAQLVATIVATARPGDHILVMSNGGFGGIHQRLLDALAERYAS
ncbi:UDP-N-acetylmuramate:L-alanyl-gamma-D-glutamyl-meso-diaminopimelate ligase [Parvibium lacunae]|uniref:UDP-N-acetylmuramate--L-alanyl-gamma-D-glutamyl-meso-2,6-diaminoheptandioate ligase n=1 Tax=Parvibium lacunae TaxID=1888893 RepID=A0A368L0B1_9BURK|nr:UDP-N-acetylmuramate:L-alanyl-gamma-D-glutamyl-meso-diaminopimelate ligase [Parvibium lacunae]RCS56721.1 UDP-N-acetylmuramate:L-alanyl-gamma-D-glutamyl-meso-diaminopimelate ligase [Parvibium lacunae]